MIALDFNFDHWRKIMPRIPRLIFLGWICIVLFSCSNSKAQQEVGEIDWLEILGPSQGIANETAMNMDWNPEVKWLDNMEEAMKNAKENDQPIFVTMRCIPCKQCSDFDKDVLENDGTLKEVLKKFVTVRLTSIRDIDLRLFPIEDYQDLDLSWWGWFFSPKGSIYGIYGGRDHVSDTTRMSITSLVETSKRILAHHYDPRRAQWKIDGPIPELSDQSVTPLQLPGWESWNAKAHEEVRAQKCLHCHQVSEIVRQPLFDAKQFNKQTDFDVWPLPENTGLILNRDHGLQVDSIIPNSPASEIGIMPNDILGAAAGRKLFSQADFMGVLHRGPKEDGIVPIKWLRDGELFEGELKLKNGWRKTVLEWRKSVAESDIGAHWGGGWPIRTNPELRAKLKLADDEMAINSWHGKNPGGLGLWCGIEVGAYGDRHKWS